MPISQADEDIVSSVLRFFSKVIRIGDAFLNFHKDLLDAVKGNLLLILESTTRKIHQCLDSKDVNIERQENTESVKNSIQDNDLAGDILTFLLHLFRTLSVQQLISFAATSSIIKTLKKFLQYSFMTQYPHLENPKEICDCLCSLMIFASQPGFGAVIKPDLMVDIIPLLLHIINRMQHRFANASHGNAYSYQGRNLYRWTCLTLRNISQAAADEFSITKTWFWGNHWLVDNDIDWLFTMMNDDDKSIQSIGLGILSNIVLEKTSYRYLYHKIPRYLDMALSFLLDFERSEYIRKEAVCVVINFLYTFGKDLSEEFSKSSISPLSRTPSPMIPWSPQRQQQDPLADMLKVFERTGFFDRILYVMDCEPEFISLRLALTELLLNLTLLAPEVIGTRLKQGNVWPVLLKYLLSATPSTWTSISLSRLSDEKRNSYDFFKIKQFHEIHDVAEDVLRTNVLKLTHHLGNNAELISYWILETPMVQLLSRLTEEMWLSSLSEDGKANYNPKWSPERWALLEKTFELISSLLLELQQRDASSLLTLFHVESSGHSPLLQLALLLVLQQQSLGVRRASCIFWGRALCLHFGEVIQLDLDEALKYSPCDISNSSSSIGSLLCRELLSILLEDYDDGDFIYMESVKLSLHCLLGRCLFAKRIILQG